MQPLWKTFQCQCGLKWPNALLLRKRNSQLPCTLIFSGNFPSLVYFSAQSGLKNGKHIRNRRYVIVGVELSKMVN